LNANVKPRAGLIIAIFLLAGIAAFDARASEFDVARAARAVNQKNYKDASMFLERALKEKPSDVDALELKVIVAKERNQPGALINTLNKLLKIGNEKSWPPQKMAGYQFLLGTAYAKKGDAKGARVQFTAARDSAKAQIDSPSLEATDFFQEIFDKSNSYLAGGEIPQAEPATEGQKPLLFGAQARYDYDSNIPLSSSESSATSSGKIMLLGALQYVPPASESMSTKVGFRMNYNYILNRDLIGFQYWTNEADGHLVFSPRQPTHYGVLLKGAYALRGNKSASGAEETKGFLTSFGAGPTWESITSARTLSAIVTLEMLNFASDSETSSADAKQSGLLIDANVLWSKPRIKGNFNPSARGGFSMLNASGKEARSLTFGGTGTNGFVLDDKLSIDAIAGLSITQYPQASRSRSDTLISLLGEATYQLKPTSAVIGRFEYNTSSSSAGSAAGFKRMVFGVGYSAIF
ncbi:MAG: hypothetical protein ABL958_05750, partial [Bdellovibrionia bacterium]